MMDKKSNLHKETTVIAESIIISLVIVKNVMPMKISILV